MSMYLLPELLCVSRSGDPVHIKTSELRADGTEIRL